MNSGASIPIEVTFSHSTVCETYPLTPTTVDSKADAASISTPLQYPRMDSGAIVTPHSFNPTTAVASYSSSAAPSILQTKTALLPHCNSLTAGPTAHHSRNLYSNPILQQPYQQLQSQHQHKPQRHAEIISYQASEFVAFSVYKLWHRPIIKRRLTAPLKPAMARDIPQHALVVGGSACTTASAAQSEAAPHTNHRTHSNPTHFGSTSGMYSYQHSHSTNSLPLQPLLPLTTPQSVSCTTATMSHESTTACSPHSVSAPFNSVVCPQGTRQWYPAFFQAVHTVLSKSGCSLPHILIALLYVARLRQLVPANITGEGSEYRVFVSALILAQKFHSDDRYSNRAWAAITKLPLVEINTMEREFLLSIGNRLHVRDTDYSKWEETIRVLGQEHSVAQAAAHLHQLEFSHPSKYPQTNNGLLGVNRSASHMQYDNPLANEDDLFEADSVSSRRAHTFPRHSQGNLS